MPDPPLRVQAIGLRQAHRPTRSVVGLQCRRRGSRGGLGRRHIRKGGDLLRAQCVQRLPELGRAE